MVRRFFYHALGAGLGGQITRPFSDVIEAQAATALPVVGGYASSHVDGYRFHDIVSVRSARIHAVGSEAGDGSFNTSVSVTIEGLNILDVITADVVTARLSSRHAPDAAQPSITAVGTAIRGLRIGGHAIDVELDHELFFEERTYDGFKEHTKKRDAVAVSKQFLWGRTETERKEFGETVPQGPGEWPESKGMVVCSLVKRLSSGGEDLEKRAAGLKARAYVIHVPTVGRVFLAETVVSHHARRLTMLRAELGSPVGGRMETCSIEVDGTTYP